MDEDATCYRSRPRPSPHCVKWGSSCPQKGHNSPSLFGPCLLSPWSPISATAELLFVNIVHIYRVSIRVRVWVRVNVSSTWQKTIIMVAFYMMLARPVGSFFTVLRMNVPVMLIAEDICGRRLGLCWYAGIGVGLAPLVCQYLHTGYRYGQTYQRIWARGTSARTFSPCATNTGRPSVSTSTRIRSHCSWGRLQIRVDIPQDLHWQAEVLTIRADTSLNK